MFYLVKTPGWVKKLFGSSTWYIPGTEKAIYLTFDDGPHPNITPFVLDELKKYNARATFFCIGKNVEDNPAVYKRILDEGHAVGNHTYNHLDGWKTSSAKYLADVLKAKEFIKSDLFRPPYGRITVKQRKGLSTLGGRLKIIMWSVLSGDFDKSITSEQCCANVIKNTGNGSVVVFHDSEKAMERMGYSLPIVLQHFFNKGYSFEKIDRGNK
ncbi:MAG: polysaccharide deacetylase family protein [Ferruginibacter sp.]